MSEVHQPIDLAKGEAESLEEYVWRLGSAKVDPHSRLSLTWQDLADLFNKENHTSYDESYWRKLFKQMQLIFRVQNAPGSLAPNITPRGRSVFREFEVEQQRVRDERTAYRKEIREEARAQDLADKLCAAVQSIPAFTPPQPVQQGSGDRAVYAMLSDIHYGMTFANAVGVYSTEIAQQRVFEYARELARIQKETGASDLYVSLMGDLISGQIHPSIRVENRENIVNQIIGVSELIADFIYLLAHSYEHIYVNAVDGNHSRIESNLKNDIRSERLDRLIPWFCKARLSTLSNVTFVDAQPDSSIGVFEIYKKTYVCVHGDFDMKKDTVHDIQQLIGKPIDYFLSAHMHVPDMRFERVGFIRNGAIVSSGDDYTVRNRLFGKPCQVCMVLNDKGVEAVYPVQL